MDAPRLTTIEISKDYLHFNAAHFTIFSKAQREDLHGHTFYVRAFIDALVGEDGLAFDYNLIKVRLENLCDGIDEKVLLPERSPHLDLIDDGGYLVAVFDGEKLPFLPRDVVTLPVRNITVEELAAWFLDSLTCESEVMRPNLTRLEIQVSSGPGQWAGSQWQAGGDTVTGNEHTENS